MKKQTNVFFSLSAWDIYKSLSVELPKRAAGKTTKISGQLTAGHVLYSTAHAFWDTTPRLQVLLFAHKGLVTGKLNLVTRRRVGSLKTR